MTSPAVVRPTEDVAAIQRRAVTVLSTAQVFGGLAIAGSVAAGSLIAASVADSEAAAGLAQTARVLGAAVLALPLGLGIGWSFAYLLSTYLADEEAFRFLFVISNSTYGLAVSVVLAASVLSALLVRRKLDHLDLIAVLKSRE